MRVLALLIILWYIKGLKHVQGGVHGALTHKQYKSGKDYKYRYPLAPLSAENIFAQNYDKKSKTEAEEDYNQLFDKFTDKLRLLLHMDDIELWSQHFDSLLMTYTSLIPAARVNDVVHDVSLYDHSRTTAAFAAALYQYHHSNSSLEEKAIKDNSPNKFLLVTGDFYGIQEFIFSAGGELNKNRSKILRGRSFAVSLFSELAADMLCRAIDLPHLSVMLNAAGKFTILAPNTSAVSAKIKQVDEKINRWLFKISYGQSSLGIVCTEAAPADYIGGHFATLWNEKHLANMDRKKFNKIDINEYGGVVDNYLDGFNNTLAKPLCPLCGKRPASKKAALQDLIPCVICRDHIVLGTFLVKGERLAVFTDKKDLPRHKSLIEPIFGEYQISFTDKTDDVALKLFELQVGADGSLPVGATLRLINGYVPVYEGIDREDDRLSEDEEQTIKPGEPVTFNHLAAKAREITSNGIKGVEALGILKADVDNLGVLMAAGLSDELFTISRLATISRQLNYFFTIYLPKLLADDLRFRSVYTVFAGGDDLFLIGPWRIMADLALQLRHSFAEYVCNNNQITFSAGISVQKTHVPVDKLAFCAEEALEQAKDNTEKNSVTMFGATVNWDDFALLLGHKNIMERWLTDKLVGKAMMYKFNQLVELARREKEIVNGKAAMIDMECLKWRSKFRYAVARNINTAKKGEERQVAIEEVSEMVNWLTDHGGAVRIPLWQLLYEDR